MESVNSLGIVLAAVSNMVVGMLWYGAVFGKTWKDMMGFTDESMKNMPLSPMQATLGGFVTALVMAYVLANFIYLSGVQSFASGWKLAFWVWAGFLATNSAGVFLWEGKPFKLFVLNSGYWLVSIMLMVLILLSV